MAGTGGKQSYHHGDLAQAALDIAYGVVAAAGADALSMREVAARIGVTHRALYRHHADREALLDAVAAEGYARLAQALEAGAGRRRAPRTFLQAYADFALASPHLYALMMTRDRHRIAAQPALKAAVDRVIKISERVFDDTGPAAARRDRIVALWSLVHGAVTLYRAGLLRAASDAQFVGYVIKLAEKSPLSSD